MSRRHPPPISRVLLSDAQLDAIAEASHELPPERGGLLWSKVMRHLNLSAIGPTVSDAEVRRRD
jgi:hypothetical protein